ncbi:MAG: hypothetical protein M5U09_10635 [Gammaproteobacteria bacterium]|nr:hypothetical protein [Gammaproteobacteria bacterium]
MSDGTRFSTLPVGGAADAFRRLTARLARPRNSPVAIGCRTAGWSPASRWRTSSGAIL